jgi:hypothetical protein
VARITANDAAPPGGPAGGGVFQVGLGKRDPAAFVLDTYALTLQVDGLHDGGADAGHRIQYQLAGAGVGGDQVAGDRGQHLGGVGTRSA